MIFSDPKMNFPAEMSAGFMAAIVQRDCHWTSSLCCPTGRVLYVLLEDLCCLAGRLCVVYSVRLLDWTCGWRWGNSTSFLRYLFRVVHERVLCSSKVLRRSSPLALTKLDKVATESIPEDTPEATRVAILEATPEATPDEHLPRPIPAEAFNRARWR